MADEPTPIDWSSIADDVAQFSKAIVDEVSARTKDNADLAKQGHYDFDHAVEDIKFFWTTVAESAAFALDTFNKRVVKRDGQ